MDELDAIRSFVAVARQGGFSAAGRALGVPLPTVSRKVAQLEANLGVRLLVRSTRNVSLTDSGKTYFTACERLLDDLREANEEAIGEYRVPKGDLTVTAPIGMGRKHLQPVVHEFLQAYPQVNLNLLLADRVVNLLEDQVDCALRAGELPDSGLVAKPLGRIRRMVCAAPGYLRQAGAPAHPRDLMKHACVSWTALGPFRTWQLSLAGEGGAQEEPVPISVRFATSTPESAVAAAVEGLGLVQATSYQMEEFLRDGSLVPVLRDFEPPEYPVHLVYPKSRRVPLKLRAFLDFTAPRLTQRLAEIERYTARLGSKKTNKKAAFKKAAAKQRAKN